MFFATKEIKPLIKNGKCVGVIKKTHKKESTDMQIANLNPNGLNNSKSQDLLKNVETKNSQYLASKQNKSQSSKPKINPKVNPQPFLSQPKGVEIKPHLEPSVIDDDSRKSLSNHQQEFEKQVSINTTLITKKLLGNIQISDLVVVKDEIYDVVRDLGQETLSAQDAIRKLVGLAIGVSNNTLTTEKKLPEEESGHEKKYFINEIWNLTGKLCSGTATVPEVINQLIRLATRLSAPPPKATSTVNPTSATKPGVINPENTELTKSAKPVPKGTGATGSKEDGKKIDGAGKKLDLTGGKGKEKEKPTNQGGESETIVPGKPDELTPNVAGEKKDVKKGTTADLTKPDAPIQIVAGEKKDDMKAVPPADSNKKDVLVGSGVVEHKTQGNKTNAVNPPQTLTIRTKAEDADLQRGVIELNIHVNAQEGKTGSASQPVNGRADNEMIFPTTAQSLFPAAALTKQNGGNGQAQEPTQAQPALGGAETRKSPEVMSDRLAESQAQLQAQQQVSHTGEKRHGHESGHRNVAESQIPLPGYPTQQASQPRSIGEYGRYNSTEPQAPFRFPIQRHLQDYVNGASTIKPQAPPPLQKMQQADEMGDLRELGYHYVAESQNPFPPQRIPQAGNRGSIDKFGQPYPMEPQTSSMFPRIQPHRQGFVNGAPAMQNREPSESTRQPYQSQVPFTNPPYDRNTKSAPYQAQQPSNEDPLHMYFTPTAVPTPREPYLQSLSSRRYRQQRLPDSPRSSSSSESTLADEPEELGGRYTRHPIRQNSDLDRRYKARPRRENCLPRLDRSRTEPVTSRNPHQSSSSRQEAQKGSRTNSLPYGRP